MDKVFKFLSPEEIDEHIKSITRQGGRKSKNSPKAIGGTATTWTEASKMIRRQVIMDLIGQGLSRRRIVEELCARWEVTPKVIYEYYKDAINMMVADHKEVTDYYRELQIARLESLAEDAIANGDRKSALSAYDQLSKLTGQYVNKIEADVQTDQIIHFSFGDE